MRKLFAAVTAATFVVALGAPAFAAEMTVKGQIVDQACYTKDKANTAKDHGAVTDCAAMCANSFEIPLPALNNAISTPLKASLVSSRTAISSPRNASLLPTERADASNVNFPAGKLRFSSVLSISMPTAPVAPTIATCGLRFMKGQNIGVAILGVNEREACRNQAMCCACRRGRVLPSGLV